MKSTKNLYQYILKSVEYVFESGIFMGIMLVIFLLAIIGNCHAQVNFASIPPVEKFTNYKTPVSVKNIYLVQYDKELDCTWKTSHAQLSGLLDTQTEDFLNDWLSGMTYFGNCEGDKECYDFQSFHYYYKATRVTYLANNLMAFYLHEGNCKNEKDNCLENQDWEIYDLEAKRFLQEADIIRQDKKSQEIFWSLIENKVIGKKHTLVNDWKAYTRQIGLEGANIVIYLNNDIINNTKGIVLRFKKAEIENILTPCFESRLRNKVCEQLAQQAIIQSSLKN